jgi:hypothetical protein
MSNDEWLKLVIDGLDKRLDNLDKKVDVHHICLETKIDRLLEFKWKITGMAIVVGVVGAATFQLINSLIQAKGG